MSLNIYVLNHVQIRIVSFGMCNADYGLTKAHNLLTLLTLDKIASFQIWQTSSAQTPKLAANT